MAQQQQGLTQHTPNSILVVEEASCVRLSCPSTATGLRVKVALGTRADISAFDEHLFVATRSLSTATRPFVLLSEHRFGKHCMRDLHLGLYDGVKQHRNVKQ